MVIIKAIYFPFKQWFAKIKVVLFVAILMFLAYRIWEMDGFFYSQADFLISNIFRSSGLYFWTALFLCFFNWLSEASKWQTAISLLEKISISKSFYSVLTGQALNLLFPSNVGHMIGRLVNLDSQDSKIKAASMVFVCQTAQMSITFIMSLLGLYYLKDVINLSIEWVYIISVAFVAVSMCTFSVYFFRNNTYIRLFIETMRSIDQGTFLRITLFSFLRYIIFTAQYILILRFLGCRLEISTLASCLALVFMAKSMMPGFHILSDLGIREFAALLFLPLIGLQNDIAISASLYVWVINILLPSFAGAFLLLKVKWNIRFC